MSTAAARDRADGEWRPGPRVRGDGGVELATWDLGGSGPPLLLLHATGFHARMWLPVADSLRSGHRIWALDQRGHGASGHAPDGRYRDWGRFTTDLLAVVDALGLSEHPAGLAGAGHSLGGAILLLAEQRRPGTFRALYCYEPIVIPPVSIAADGGVDLSTVARKRRSHFPSRATALANYADKAPFDRFRAGALDAYVAHGFVDRSDGTVELACPPDEEASIYEGSRLHDGWAGLATTRPPVTVAAGAEDGPAAAHVEEAAARLPAGRVERYPALSHFGPMEDPGFVGTAIAAAIS